MLIAHDPLVDIRNTQRIEAVVLRGRLYTRTMLDELELPLELHLARIDQSAQMIKRSKFLIVTTGTIAAMVLLTIGLWRLHKSRSFQLFGELITSVQTQDSVVALTFDDGPGSVYTDSVLDVLRAANARATFFVTGEALERQPLAARRIIAEGHELGNHSYSHRRLVLVSQRTMRFEVERTDSLIRTISPSAHAWFRPPYGKRLIGLPWYLARTGRSTVLWSIEPDTWYRDADEMTSHVMENVRPGAIILLHVELRNRHEERRALTMIIDGLQQRGYQLVTLSELVAGRISET